VLFVQLLFISLPFFSKQFGGRLLSFFGLGRCKCASNLGWTFHWSYHDFPLFILDEPNSSRRADAEFVSELFGNRRLSLARDGDGGPLFSVAHT
jgi:hypothetical protein